MVALPTHIAFNALGYRITVDYRPFSNYEQALSKETVGEKPE
jgi:hypothetical protein